MQATVLSIAGSDPTGGAGIQADLKTMTSIGVFGAAAVTCITVQNSHGVARVEYLPADLVYEQIKIVLDDQRVTHIKIGMVGTVEIGRAISAALSDFNGEIVYDPVMFSSTGHSLAEDPAFGDPTSVLADTCTVLTPNIPELEQIAKATVSSLQDVKHHAGLLLDRFRNLRLVLVKGGHRIKNDEITDILVYKTQGTLRHDTALHPAINTSNIHGTGCTLASAFTAFHCLSGDDLSSFRQSIQYVQTVLQNSKNKEIIKNRKGTGSMLHFSWRS